ncbi:hypothetical protein ACYSNW_01075 [Enterococcus sp. LJL99]
MSQLEKTNKIYMVNQFETTTLEELKDSLLDWLFFIRIVTTPVTFRFGEEPVEDFDVTEISRKIATLERQENLWIKVNAEEGEFQIHVVDKRFLERTIIQLPVFLAHEAMIENYYDTRIEAFGVFGFMRPLNEYLYNNIEKIDRRTFETAEETEKLPKRYNDSKEIVVDCNQLAGFDLYYKGLCFTSCWKMYFSDAYFTIIPKQIFLEIQQVHSVQELKNNHIKITLFANPVNWDKEVNQVYQRLFRDQLGFDQLGWNNGIGVLRPPYIEYAFTEDAIQTVQYQNHQFQPVEKKKATHFVTRSYNPLNKEYVENRTNGILNAQAYFPWVDESNQRMMNYRVLDPDLTIDNGISAYEFYIRQFLEIDINDEKYQTFTSVLRFYLPKEAMAAVPFKALQDNLNDINISNLTQKEHSARFDLRKARNHLQVVFLDYSRLESIHETLEEGD